MKDVMEVFFAVACAEIKKIAGMLNLKLKKKAATKARKGVSLFTKEPCVFNG
mgnify:CR=1 FL=1